MTNSVETVLTEAVPPGKSVNVAAPGIRHGDIEANTGSITVGGFAQPSEPDFDALAVDYDNEIVIATNCSDNPWAVGAKLVITWEGLPLEATVADHETRITSLEAGGTGGAGGVSQADFDALVARVDTHDWQINEHEGRIVANKNKNDAQDIRLTALEAPARKTRKS